MKSVKTIDAVDILIIGGGLTGMALMLALAPLGYRVRLVEAREMVQSTPHMLETRSIALSPASIQILKELEIWSELTTAFASIDTIHISEQGRFGQARLNRKEVAALGAVVEMHVLLDALQSRMPRDAVYSPARVIAQDKIDGIVTLQTTKGERKIQAKWVIAADGTHSSMRALCGTPANIKPYPEDAIATNIALSRKHHNIAYERFTKDGPLALLPLTGHYMALVWTLKKAEARALKALPDTDFLKALQNAFGYRAGRFVAVGKRQTYPLQQLIMPNQVDGRVIYIGNAAHTLHPVAGQGLNLGLRDVAMLSECAAKYGLTAQALTQYQAKRKSDQAVITKATDGLVSLFKQGLPGVGFLRQMGLLALDNSVFLKQILLRHAKGFGGVVPDLVCGVPLQRDEKVSL